MTLRQKSLTPPPPLAAPQAQPSSPPAQRAVSRAARRGRWQDSSAAAGGRCSWPACRDGCWLRSRISLCRRCRCRCSALVAVLGVAVCGVCRPVRRLIWLWGMGRTVYHFWFLVFGCGCGCRSEEWQERMVGLS